MSIEGAPDIYVQSGSELKLKCLILHHTTQPPLFIFWYHNSEVIKQSSSRGGITVESSKNGTTISVMNINKVQQKDSGNYSCKPSYADPAFITVHVLNGKINIWKLLLFLYYRCIDSILKYRPILRYMPMPILFLLNIYIFCIGY